MPNLPSSALGAFSVRPRRPSAAAMALGAVILIAGLAAGSVAGDETLFVDASAELGLDHAHFNGMTGELYYPEMIGPGAAFLDYDGDGDLDLYLVQGAMLDGRPPSEALFPPRGPLPPSDRLYRNDPVRTPAGATRPRFVDVTERAGLAATGYGMGVATGDVDGDGHVDLYVSNLGRNQLWRNRGDGTFEDVTAASGTGDERWSAGATFFDADRDGRLDLFVVNYVRYDVEKNVVCYATSSRRDYCGPDAFEPVADALYRNLGTGSGGPRFADVSLASGVGRPREPGLGAVAADLDGDGWSDLYVTNDGRPNFLWLNQRGRGGEIAFRDEALLAGVAVNLQGRPEASMGIDAGDVDQDGDLDLFMTHLDGETNTLYLNEGGGLFRDGTLESGLGAASLPYTSFGTGWIDVDLDGWLDLVIVNGAVKLVEALARAGDPYPLGQPNQVFGNRAGRGFEDWSGRAGEAFARVETSRGLAWGDVDGDGDDDLLIANNNAPARLLENRAGDGRPWLGLRVLDRAGAPATGARVRVTLPGGGERWRRVATDGSYGSARDPRARIGLGATKAADAVRVLWPDGRSSEWRRPPTGRSLVVQPLEKR